LYQNDSSINGIEYHICEDANSTNCPYIKRNGDVEFTCLSSCDATNKYNLSGLCVSTCFNESRKFLSSDGSNCVSSCSVGYSVVGSEAQCVLACSWPNAFFVDTNYDSSEKRCNTSCPSGTYLSRSNQNYVSSCGYRNST